MADKIKEVEWGAINLEHAGLERALTRLNFQPGKFHIIPHATNNQLVTVIYVKSEK